MYVSSSASVRFCSVLGWFLSVIRVRSMLFAVTRSMLFAVTGCMRIVMSFCQLLRELQPRMCIANARQVQCAWLDVQLAQHGVCSNIIL